MPNQYLIVHTRPRPLRNSQATSASLNVKNVLHSIFPLPPIALPRSPQTPRQPDYVFHLRRDHQQSALGNNALQGWGLCSVWGFRVLSAEEWVSALYWGGSGWEGAFCRLLSSLRIVFDWVVMADDEVIRLWRVALVRLLVKGSQRGLRLDRKTASSSRDIKILVKRAGLSSSIIPFILPCLMPWTVAADCLLVAPSTREESFHVSWLQEEDCRKYRIEELQVGSREFDLGPLFDLIFDFREFIIHEKWLIGLLS